MTEVAGKTIYVTGGTRGMGLLAAKMLAGLGAHVAVFANHQNAPALHEVESAPFASPARDAVPTQRRGSRWGDHNRREGRDRIRGAGRRHQHGRDRGRAELIDMKFEAFDRIIQVNLYGARNVVEAVLPSMLARGSGKIVLVGSMGGIVAVYGYTAYGASKFAVVGLAQCLRYELKPRGISVACFCPGEVDTPGLAEDARPFTRQARR